VILFWGLERVRKIGKVVNHRWPKAHKESAVPGRKGHLKSIAECRSKIGERKFGKVGI
jgi:hypothetical protein